MHRFYLPPECCAGHALRLDGREAHHALHVLRLKRGEPVEVLDGAGNEFFCEVESIARDGMELRVTKRNSIPPLPCQITLLQALPRGKIIESIIQKAVELGAHRIVPLLTERVVTHLDDESAEHKREKWRQVAIEAVKQCGAAWLPEIAAPTPLVRIISQKPQTGSESLPGSIPSAFSLQPSAFDLSLVGSLQPDRRRPQKIFREFEQANGRLPTSVAVWIGPEGDFTPDELQAIEAGGARPISLGRLVLRVETAAIYCLSILNYELNRPGAPVLD